MDQAGASNPSEASPITGSATVLDGVIGLGLRSSDGVPGSGQRLGQSISDFLIPERSWRTIERTSLSAASVSSASAT